MKIKCLHGFFIIEETSIAEVSEFMRDTGLTVVPYGDNYTFDFIADAPEFSLEGMDYLGFTAVANYEGKPWEIFKANGIVYDFIKKELVSLNSIVSQSTIKKAGNKYYANGIVKAGTIATNGKRILDYNLFYSSRRSSWLYSGVGYE